jgi:hypothetical protein
VGSGRGCCGAGSQRGGGGGGSAAVSMETSPPPRPQVLGDMARHGWDGLLVPLVRFWEGERSRERLLAGVTDRNERDLLEYVYDTYFAPLMDHTPVVLDPLAMADGFVRKHKVRPHCRERRTVESWRGAPVRVRKSLLLLSANRLFAAALAGGQGAPVLRLEGPGLQLESRVWLQKLPVFNRPDPERSGLG